MRNFLELASTIGGVTLKKKATTDGGEYCGRCPMCGGTDRFVVWPYTDRPHFWCRKCGQKGDEIDFVRLVKRVNYKEACEIVGKVEPIKKAREIKQKTSWDIRDCHGNYVATHTRIDYTDGSKEYPWEVNGKMGLQGMTPSELPLYGSNLLSQWDSGDIVICEGEKSTDSLLNAGYKALGSVCGATNTPAIETLRPLSEKPLNVILWPDNDIVGVKHMELIGSQLKKLGIEYYVVQWNEAKNKQDAADYVAMGLPVQPLLDNSKVNRTAPYYPPSYHIDESYDMFMSAFDGEDPRGFISTGYKMLDDAIDGYGKWLTVICARPGVGKTSFALQSVIKSATPENKAVIVSLETPTTVILDRLVTYECGLSRSDVRKGVVRGRYSDKEKPEMMTRTVHAYATISDLPLLISDKQGISPERLKSDIEMLLEREKIGVILIDHMGKMKGQGKTTYERASYVSKELASMAIEYQVPIVVICQLNREVERMDRKDRRPRLADLRSSGEIEEDARVVLGLYRDDYYMDSDPVVTGLFQVMVLKHSEGESRLTVPLHCDQSSRKLTDWPRERQYQFENYIKERAWLPKGR